MANADNAYVLIARLIRPQGRHGEILADILTDFPELYSERREVFLLSAGAGVEPRTAAIERHWLHKGRVVLKFAGVDSINEAEALRGLDVGIAADKRAPLPEDAVYISDLIGCRLIDEAGGRRSEVGAVVDVQRERVTTDLLVVRTSSDGELLVPFAKAYLVSIDLGAREVRMRLPEGLTAVNAPLTPEERARQAAEAAE